MPITVRIGLEKNSTQGVFQGISGNGKGFGEILEVEDRARKEELFQLIKGLLTSRSPIPVIVFLCEVQERAGDHGVVRDKLMIEIDKAKE